MRLLPACIVASLIVSGCGSSPGLPAWIGGEPTCRLEGTVVDDGRLLPAIPAEPLGGVMGGPLGHYLPEDGTSLTVRLRIDDKGHVTSACAVGNPDPALSSHLVRRFNHTCEPAEEKCYPATTSSTPFRPASLDGRAVPSVVEATYRWVRRVPADAWRWTAAINEIRSSKNEARLESIALGRPDGSDAAGAGEAYVRLGQLGTWSATEALARIEHAARTDDIDIPRAISSGSPIDTNPIARAKGSDGEEFLLVSNRLFTWGPVALSRRSGPSAEWSRPVLVPITIRERGPYSPPSALAVTMRRQVVISWYDIDDAGGNPAKAPESGPHASKPRRVHRSETFDLDELERDSDGDGWTDIEEARMGLDPRNPDTDRDGIPDGRDRCPNLAAGPRGDGGGAETSEIITKAALALFGLPSTPHWGLQMVGPSADRVSLIGQAGPFIYERATNNRTLTWSRSERWVSWQIILRTRTTAAVVFEDSVSNFGGTGYEVFLCKRYGRWCVIFSTHTWVS